MRPLRLSAFCLLAAWVCAPAVAQHRAAPSEAALDARAVDFAAAPRVDPSAVRIVSPSAVDLGEVTWAGQRGGAGDSLAYFDTTGAEFAVQINSDAGQTNTFSLLEESQRFTPGYGISPPCGPGCPRGGVASSAGQVTEFGFRLAGGGVQGPGDLLLVFSKFEAGNEGRGFIRPSTDLVLAVDLALLAPGFNVVDVSAFNLFFEDDEEWIWGMQVNDDGGSPAFARPVLDDGTANIGPLAEPGYYTPRRSGFTAYFPSGPVGAGFYFATRPDENNHWWYNRLAGGRQPTVDTEVNAACGTTALACQFGTGDTVGYTACGQNTTSSTQPVTFRVFAVGPRVPSFPLFEQTVPIPAGVGACRTFSNRLPAVAPPGRYLVRVDVTTSAGTLLDYDQFFFLKLEDDARPPTGEPPTGERPTGGMTPADWLTRSEGEWTFAGLDLGAAAARSESARSEGALSEGAAVVGAFPNPFARATTIRFATSEAAEARLAVYDVTGREVAVLLSGPVEAGQHEAVFDARGLASGLYVYRLEAGRTVETGRITLLR